MWLSLFDRLLKNRKSARKSRKRRKAELISLKDEIKLLRQENAELKAKVDLLQKEKETSSGGGLQ